MINLKNNIFTVILLSSRGGQIREIKFPLDKIILFTMIVIVFIILLISGIVSYGKVYVTALKVKVVEKQNREYSEENRKIREAYSSIRYILKQDEKLKTLLGQNLMKDNKTQSNYDSLIMLYPNLKDSLKFEIQSQKLLDITREMTGYIPNIIPVPGPISQGFSSHHPGIDIAASEGSPIIATADGKVIFAGQDLYYGNLIKIDHNNNYMTVYGHNKENIVNNGDIIKRGQIIGYVGNTGRSTAPHLHYEVRQKGIPIDPRSLIYIK